MNRYLRTMGETTVKAEIAVPAERLWGLVRDFGNIPWIPGGDEATIEGEGIGMVRSLMGGAVRERLESLDEEQKQLGYTIDQGLPIPAKDYHATMTVTVVGPETAGLEWRCTWEPDGATEEEVGVQFQGLYETMIGWIRENLGVA